MWCVLFTSPVTIQVTSVSSFNLKTTVTIISPANMFLNLSVR